MKLLSKDQQLGIFRQMYNKARDIDVAIINTLDGSMPKDFILDASEKARLKRRTLNTLNIDADELVEE